MQTFELEQLVYLVEQHNRCAKVAVCKITDRVTMENLCNVPMLEGWYVPYVDHGGLPPTNIGAMA